jgi:uncharacterized damage-inducible protein DinB
MLNEALRTMYEYGRWATGHLLDVAEGLTTEQLNASGGAGHGSIRETFIHQIVTQQRWLVWWDGSMDLTTALSYQVDEDAYPDMPAIRALWDEVEAQTFQFIDSLSAEDVERNYHAELPWGLPPTDFTLWWMMLHVANHGTQHRSEIAAMLTSAGHSPGDMDLLFYSFAQLQRPQA